MAFIVGMGRSGTTLLTNMLNSNPAVISTPENEFLLFSKASFAEADFSREAVIDSFLGIFNYNYNRVLSIWKPNAAVRQDMLEANEKSFANACRLVYMNYPFANKDKVQIKCVIDKNPIYSLYIDDLRRIYPAAKYIILTRDFRDNVVSRKKYSDKKSSVAELGASWNFFYERIYDVVKKHRLDHYLLRYEDLVAEPEQTLKQLCAYLGVEYSSTMLQFQELSKEINTHVKEKASAEVYNKISRMHGNLEKQVNLNRVKAYEKELSPGDINMLNYVCRKYGREFDYLAPGEAAPVKASWRLLNAYNRLKMKVYFALHGLYYSLPVGLRLRLLKKQ